jgi:cytosine/adenosine deaminase-related metal-dependent hydrolase
MHPLDIVDLDVCNLDSNPLTLKELSAFVAQCVAHYRTPPGQQLIVHQWSYTAGNQPDAQSLRDAIEVGKSADFIVVDRDILALADSGHAQDVAETRVLGTWFQGKKVYTANKP